MILKLPLLLQNPGLIMWNGVTHGCLGLPTSKNNQDSPPQTDPRPNQSRQHFIESPFSGVLNCIKLTKSSALSYSKSRKMSQGTNGITNDKSITTCLTISQLLSESFVCYFLKCIKALF